MMTAEHRRPFAAFLLVFGFACVVLVNGLREQVVRVFVDSGAPRPLISAVVPDIVLGHSLHHAPVQTPAKATSEPNAAPVRPGRSSRGPSRSRPQVAPVAPTGPATTVRHAHPQHHATHVTKAHAATPAAPVHQPRTPTTPTGPSTPSMPSTPTEPTPAATIACGVQAAATSIRPRRRHHGLVATRGRLPGAPLLAPRRVGSARRQRPWRTAVTTTPGASRGTRPPITATTSTPGRPRGHGGRPPRRPPRSRLAARSTRPPRRPRRTRRTLGWNRRRSPRPGLRPRRLTVTTVTERLSASAAALRGRRPRGPRWPRSATRRSSPVIEPTARRSRSALRTASSAAAGPVMVASSTGVRMPTLAVDLAPRTPASTAATASRASGSPPATSPSSSVGRPGLQVHRSLLPPRPHLFGGVGQERREQSQLHVQRGRQARPCRLGRRITVGPRRTPAP